MGGVHVVGGGCCEAPTLAGAAESCRAWHMRAVIFHQIRRSRGICRNLFTYGMFLSFAFTQIPELSTNNSPSQIKRPNKKSSFRVDASASRQIFGRCALAIWSRFLLDGHRKKTRNRAGFGRISRRGRKVFGSEVSLIAHLAGPVPLTRGPGARSKRARLTSPELTRVDCAPCSPTPSGAFSLRRPRARRPSLHPLRALFFTPRAFPNVSRSDGGASPSRGARRRPAEQSGLTPPGPQIPP